MFVLFACWFDCIVSLPVSVFLLFACWFACSYMSMPVCENVLDYEVGQSVVATNPPSTGTPNPLRNFGHFASGPMCRMYEHID